MLRFQLCYAQWQDGWKYQQVGTIVSPLNFVSLGYRLQVITHVSNLWDVAFTPDGDLLTACSDFVARLWTPHATRQVSV